MADTDIRQRKSGGPEPDTVSTVSSVIELKRKVGLLGGVSFVIGSIIGSGIFISPGGVADRSGSVGLTLIVWVLCGLIALCGALSLAELGTFIPKSGGEYPYIYEAFGAVPAYLFSWTAILVLKPSAMAIITLTCSEYVLDPFFDDDCGSAPSLHMKLFACVVIFILTALNVYSSELAIKVNIVFTIAKVFALCIIIVGGIVRIFEGYTENLESGFENTQSDISKLALAFFDGMWSYDGWNNLNYITEEIVNPHRNLPLSLLIGMPVITILYLLVNISYFTVMSVPEMVDSAAVGIDWAEAVIYEVRYLMPVFVAFSTFGAANGTLYATGRLNYEAAKEGHFVEAFSMINVRNYTPSLAVILTGVIGALMVIPGDIGSLINFFNMAVWGFYGLTMLALMVLRVTQKDVERPFKVPIILPVIVLLASCYLLVAPVIDEPEIEYMYAMIFVFGGLLFYLPFVHWKWRLPGMDLFTTFCQLLFEIVPEETHDDGDLVLAADDKLHNEPVYTIQS